nr:autotransporter assembly complex family protein [Thalassovita sp.]
MKPLSRCLSALTLSLGLCAVPLHAFESLDITLSGPQNDDLLSQLRRASLLRMAKREQVTDPQDVFSTALADYQRLLETLYANGYYSGVIRIRLDGREASQIPPLDPPARISKIDIAVAPGRQFRFGAASVAPLPAGTTLPEGFRTGQPAKSTAVLDAVETAVDGWRMAGHAKAQPSYQHLLANHPAQTLDARIGINPGPAVRFGPLTVTGDSRVRATAVRRISGLPVGQPFSPAEVEKAATRLRRTGAFRSVSLTESDTVAPDGSMGITAAVVDEKPRRFGAGAELSNFEGLTLSGFWMHRNLLGGAERLRIEARISGIEGDTGGMDYSLSARVERPAVFGPDTKFYIHGEIESLDENDYRSDNITLGVGASRTFSDHLEGDLELAVSHFDTSDAFGDRTFTLFSTPVSLRWDHRDDVLNPTRGHYVNAKLTPFLGLSGEAGGAQLKLDSRIYRPLGDRFVAAGRFQLGSVVGPSLSETAPDYLFYSGGGGTVRGQPYQSLNVDLGGGDTIGGRSFLGVSGELRARVTGAISVVGFADAGYIGSESLFDGSGNWHSGAGIGLRYDTAVGPIRLDIAGPLSGDTGSGVQIYIGIGQAF